MRRTSSEWWTLRGSKRVGLAAVLAASVLASLMAAVGAPTPAEAELSYAQPNIPKDDLQLLDLPAFPSWLMASASGVQNVHETDVGVQFNEFGAAAGVEFDAAKAVSANPLDVGGALASARRSTFGDLNGNGIPEVYGLGTSGFGFSDDVSAGTPGGTKSFAADVTGHGTVVNLGVLDGGTNAGLRGVWIITDQGFVVLYQKSGTSMDKVLTLQIPLVDGERILDATSPSVLDQDVVASGPVLHVPTIAVLRSSPFGQPATATRSRVAEDSVFVFPPVSGRPMRLEYSPAAAEGQLLDWLVGDGRIRQDYARVEGDLKRSTAAFVTRADDAKVGHLLSSAYSGPFCPSQDPNRVPEFDYEAFDGNGSPVDYISCAADAGVAGGKRQLRVDQAMAVRGGGAGTTSSWTYPTGAAPSGPSRIVATTVDLPCPWLSLLPSVGGGCKSPNNDRRSETIVHQIDAAGATRVDVVGRYPNRGNGDGTFGPGSLSAVDNTIYGRSMSPGAATITPLPQGRNRVRIRLDDRTKPTVVNGRPRPIVVLAAPPYVNGAGQVPLAGPTYNVRRTTGGSTSFSTSNSIGVTFGLEIGDPTGLFGVSATASLTAEVGSEVTTALEVTSSEQFVGSPYEDTIVYSAPTYFQYPGTVIESSTGVALNTDVTLNVPRSDIITSSTLSALQRQYGTLFTGGDGGKGILNRVLTHEAGDPSGYTKWGTGADGTTSPPKSTNVATYCDGASFDDNGTTVDERSSYPFGVVENPFANFQQPPLDYEGPGILNSERHEVQAGPNTSEGAGFSITDSTEQSRSADLTVGAELGVTVGGVTASASAEHTWGQSWSSSFSSGVDFLGYVGHIPFEELESETYDWRVFLCKKRLGDTTGTGAPVWVLNYTVDSYTGSGGLDELGPIHLKAPIQSEFTDPLPTYFQWSQESGTVKSYDLDLEAVGYPDVRSQDFRGIFPVATVAEAKARDLSKIRLFPDGDYPPLVGNQLYRWRVTSNDFFGNAVTSDWDYFVTVGKPVDLHLEASDPSPSVGEDVHFTLDHRYADSPDLVFLYNWDLGDGRTVAGGRTRTFRWDTPGLYLVRATVYSNESSSITVPIVVGPEANDESYSMIEDATLTKDAASGVMSNDTGAESVKLTTQAARGTVVLQPDGAFTYTPRRDECGTDAFTYTVRGGVSSKQATATIQITCVNDRPTAVDQAFLDELEDRQLVVSAPGVLAGSADPEGTALTAQLVLNATHGRVALASDGSFTYTPETDYCGSDSFTYRVSDGQLSSTPSSRVVIRLTCVNDAPTVTARSFDAVEDTPLTVDMGAGLRSGAADVDSEELTIAVSTTPTKGSVAVAPDGSFTYEPNANACGLDTFGYTASDGELSSPSAVATVDVACVNDAPVVTAKSYSGTEDTPLEVAAADGLLLGATDVEGSDLTAGVIVPPLKGTIVVEPDGSFIYTPAADMCGGDVFAFAASDGSASSDPAMATIDLVCVNDPPVAVTDEYDAVDGMARTVAAPGVLGNDTDDSGPVTAVPATVATPGGTFTIKADGSFSYTARPGFHGRDTATYTVQDVTGLTTSGTVHFMVVARTSLTATRAKFASGQMATVQATLKTVGNPVGVAGQTIVFTVNGAPFCTATTGPDGVARCTAKSPNSSATLFGRYTATYAGTSEYRAASATTAFGRLARS